MTPSTPPPRDGPGDLAAFEALAARYGRHVYNIAYRMAGNDADAKDLAQEAFVRMYRAIGRIDPAASLEGWLYRIVTNLFIDMLRRRPKARIESLDAPLMTAKGGEVPREIPDERSDPSALVDQQLEAEVQQALMALDPDLRAVVVLSDIEGHAYEEIAGTLKIPIGTVKSRLHRARRALAARLRHRAPKGIL